MAKCVRGGNIYKRHHYNEKGVCDHCGQTAKNRTTKIDGRSTSESEQVVPAKEVHQGETVHAIDCTCVFCRAKITGS